MDLNLSQDIKQQKLYCDRFSVHFSLIPSCGNDEGKEEREEEMVLMGRNHRNVEVRGGSYEPTIVCYNQRDHVLEVRKNRQTGRQI